MIPATIKNKNAIKYTVASANKDLSARSAMITPDCAAQGIAIHISVTTMNLSRRVSSIRADTTPPTVHPNPSKNGMNAFP